MSSSKKKKYTATSDESFVKILRAIEDKIRERGMITTATGDPDADISMTYNIISENHQGKFIELNVFITTNGEDVTLDRDVLEQLIFYIDKKINELSGERNCSRRGIFNHMQKYVFLNGLRVY
jgi:hypothetical protein